jgi:hypothetical protein
MWIRIDSLATTQTLFSKDRNTFPDGLAMRAYISSTDGFLGVEIAENGNWTIKNQSVTSGNNKVTAEQWIFTGFSIELENTGNTTKVRAWINEASH